MQLLDAHENANNKRNGKKHKRDDENGVSSASLELWTFKFSDVFKRRARVEEKELLKRGLNCRRLLPL